MRAARDTPPLPPRHRGATAAIPPPCSPPGLDIVRDKQPVGLPDAPGQLRVLPVDFEGTARLRWKRPVRRCSFIVEATADPATQDRLETPARLLQANLHREGFGRREEILVPRGRRQRPRPSPWSQPVSDMGEVKGQKNFNHGWTRMNTDSGNPKGILSISPALRGTSYAGYRSK